MAQQTILAVSFDNKAGQCWLTFDDVSGDLLILRLANAAAHTIVFTAQRGNRPPQSFTAQPGDDVSFNLPTGQATKYSLVLDASNVWQTSGFVTSVQYG